MTTYGHGLLVFDLFIVRVENSLAVGPSEVRVETVAVQGRLVAAAEAPQDPKAVETPEAVLVLGGTAGERQA